jgi:hypothetical protein
MEASKHTTFVDRYTVAPFVSCITVHTVALIVADNVLDWAVRSVLRLDVLAFIVTCCAAIEEFVAL